MIISSKITLSEYVSLTIVNLCSPVIDVTILQLTLRWCTPPVLDLKQATYITVQYLFMFSITARTACLRLTGQESLVYRSLLSSLALALASQRRQVLLCDNCSFMCSLCSAFYAAMYAVSRSDKSVQVSTLMTEWPRSTRDVTTSL